MASRPKTSLKGDDVHHMLFYEEIPGLGGLHVPGGIKKLNRGIYDFGGKKLNMEIIGGELFVRTGGGVQTFRDWVHCYGLSWLTTAKPEHDLSKCQMEKKQCLEELEALKAEVARLNGLIESSSIEKEQTKRDLEEKTLLNRELEIQLAKSQTEAKRGIQSLELSLMETQNLMAKQSELESSLLEVKKGCEALSIQFQLLALKMPLYLQAPIPSIPPPIGNVTLVFTDVEVINLDDQITNFDQESTSQWEAFPEDMALALGIHNKIMRDAIAEFSGYEVKTEGDSFVVSFSQTTQATKWCFHVQQALLRANWPKNILQLPNGAEITNKAGEILFRGFRVRMGVHYGTPTCAPDPVTGRMDYFGPVVNRASRVESVAHGGQILLSAAAWAQVKDSVKDLGFPVVLDLGEFELKGISSPTRLFQVLPMSMKDRTFPTLQKKELARSLKLEEQIKNLRIENTGLATKIQILVDAVSEFQQQILDSSRNIQDTISDPNCIRTNQNGGHITMEYFQRFKEKLRKIKQLLAKNSADLERAEQEKMSYSRSMEELQEENEELKKKLDGMMTMKRSSWSKDSISPRRSELPGSSPMTIQILASQGFRKYKLPWELTKTERSGTDGLFIISPIRKKVKLQMVGNSLHARVGGGTHPFDEWLALHVKRHSSSSTGIHASSQTHPMLVRAIVT